MELKDLLKDAYKEGMTLEDVVEALKDVELPTDNSEEIQKLKVSLNNASSEAAKYKKELKSRMSDQELKDQEATNRLEELQEKYDALFKETQLAKNKAEFIALGYDEKLAEDSAKAMLEGDNARLFANQKKFNSEVEKRVKADLIQQTPPPTSGNGAKPMTIEDISKIKDPVERQQAIAEHMDLYQVNS